MPEILATGPATVPKPKPIKPKPITPKPISPKPITPIKASGVTKHCARCNAGITADTGVVRKLCSPCDLELATMHWENEHVLFRKTVYMPEEGEAAWFLENYSDVMRKPPKPNRRSFFKRPIASISTA